MVRAPFTCMDLVSGCRYSGHRATGLLWGCRKAGGSRLRSQFRVLNPQGSLLVDDLLRELAHEAAAHALIDHRTGPVRVTDVFVDPVAVTMMVVVAVTMIVMMVMPMMMIVGMTGSVVMIMTVIVVVCGFPLVIERIPELSVVMVHLNLAFREALLEGGHQVLGFHDRA